MKSAFRVLKRPLVSEKTAAFAEANKYVFEVYPGTDKKEIAKAVEATFKVTVTGVNIINTKGKVKASRVKRGEVTKSPDVKKAIVTLKAGDKIELI
ncbi:MAG: 50S ribosomal protein L23 [Opitutae bacterium]|nr:50S ribosomal protein L23 [Opitutae bacterium]MCD8298407.1 50S ribosomal protein L23 [Opitutae bacterium]